MFVWILLLCLLVLQFALSFGLYRFALYSPQGEQNRDESLPRSEQMEPLRERVLQMIRVFQARPYEEVFIRSEDGLKLRGRYYHQRDGAPLNICFHGYRGTPIRDFCGGATIALDAGYNVLMIEQRAHGGSEGHTITMGVMERRDCLFWVKYAVERFGKDQKILLSGISMGAATVLMASELALPENVRGIIADCPYTTPKAILQKVAGDMHLPIHIGWLLLHFGAKLYGGVELRGPDASEAVKHTKVPILLIHGEDDRFVPLEMSRRIAAANPEMISFYTFPDAGHGLSYMLDTPRYTELVNRFCQEILAEEEGRA